MSESVRVNLGAGFAAHQPLSIDPDVTPGSVGGKVGRGQRHGRTSQFRKMILIMLIATTVMLYWVANPHRQVLLL